MRSVVMCPFSFKSQVVARKTIHNRAYSVVWGKPDDRFFKQEAHEDRVADRSIDKDQYHQGAAMASLILSKTAQKRFTGQSPFLHKP